MEVDQTRPEKNPAMTFDEVSMERSMSFVKSLQELKNLRPQLYSAAEYCEKSYLNNEQKQTVLDNLKDYTVRALVNAVDHLGTVAYKLTDLLEQQTIDVSTMEVKVSCLNQVIPHQPESLAIVSESIAWNSTNVIGGYQQYLTCQTYTDKEGLRQQQLLAFIPRHHKHYVLPNSVHKRVQFSPHIQVDARQSHFQARSRLQPSGSPASKTLSWHLASETKPTLKGASNAINSTEDSKTSGNSSAAFQLFVREESARTRSSGGPALLSIGSPMSSAIMQTLAMPRREMLDASKPLTAFRSFENPRREIVRAPARSKSMLSAFFVKQKTPKLKAGSVS